jgi:hypothetical protein
MDLCLCVKQFLYVCAHKPRPPSNMIQIGSKYEIYHLKGRETGRGSSKAVYLNSNGLLFMLQREDGFLIYFRM